MKFTYCISFKNFNIQFFDFQIIISQFLRNSKTQDFFLIKIEVQLIKIDLVNKEDMFAEQQIQMDSFLAIHFIYDKVLYFCLLFQLLYFIAFDDKSITQSIIWSVIGIAINIENFLNFLYIYKNIEIKSKSLAYILCLFNLGEIPLLQIHKNNRFQCFKQYRLNFKRLVFFVVEVAGSIILAFLLDPKQLIIPLLAYFYPIYIILLSLFEPKIVRNKHILKSTWIKFFLEAIGQIGYQGLVLIYIIHDSQSLITMVIINLGLSVIFLAFTAQFISKHYKDDFIYFFYFIVFFGYFVDIRIPFVFQAGIIDHLEEWQRNSIVFLQLTQIVYVFVQFFIQHFSIFKDESLCFSIQALIILALSIFQIIMKIVSLTDYVILSYLKGPKIIRVNSFQQLKELTKEYKNSEKKFKRLKFLIIQFDVHHSNGIQSRQKRHKLIQKTLLFYFQKTEIITLQKYFHRINISDSKFKQQEVSLYQNFDYNFIKKKIRQGYEILDEIKTVKFYNKFIQIQIFKMFFETLILQNQISIFTIKGIKNKLQQMSLENELFQLQITAYQKYLSRYFNINPVQILYDLYLDLPINK
ncbi:transmembrane protein, putative (macronuclear) [Tetrahymena thermophila SB210]|uniref:Transmembrane protein, putative n=1 Tax=Tetrahymena thermophila (strain SB210) TaxID=312017 RepID=Q23ZA7_TETTS|nr:transmembrane protein, putative [Tetrahymena thermophila SB210]EAS01864.2 transmembrane protein, putative [Tetrahymena thermophila SB210]|eukprot:XP_001022109.2 transmembrane protein, putative [Tetrahymena thermophila SB210]